MTTFAQIIMDAHQHARLSAAEMDFSLAMGTGAALAALRGAAWRLANPILPLTVDTGQAKADALWAAVDGDAELAAMTEAAQSKSYQGWSVQGDGPIRYQNAASN
jgi:hypothetical protein